MKERLDVLLVKRNLTESRERGGEGGHHVRHRLWDGQKEDKAGSMFDETANVEKCAEPH